MRNRIELARWSSGNVLVRAYLPGGEHDAFDPVDLMVVTPRGRKSEVFISFRGGKITSSTTYNYCHQSERDVIRREMSWFFNSTLPSRMLLSAPPEVSSKLLIPTVIPEAVARTLGPEDKIERLSRVRNGLLMSGSNTPTEMSYAIDVMDEIKSYDMDCTTWPTSGLGLDAEVIGSGELDGGMSRNATSQVVKWIEDNAMASWTLADRSSTLIGVGRTPGEAIRSTGFLVFPGEEEAWRAANQLPGELLLETDLYLLLDELPPFWRQPLDPDVLG